MPKFQVEAAELKVGDKILITGPTTGAVYATLMRPEWILNVDTVKQGERFSFKIADKIRPSDKLFKLIRRRRLKAAKKRKEQNSHQSESQYYE